MHTHNSLVKNWLVLAVSSLAIAGVYSLPPVIFRGSFFKNILPIEAIFASSLVVHVDLSVLVWMLAISGMLWSQFYNDKHQLFYKSAFYSAAIGMALIAISPLTGNLNPLKNNYIPVLQNATFFIGLSLFVSGITLHVILSILRYKQMKITPIGFGLSVSAMITAIAFICFIIAGVQSPQFDYSDPTLFYEFIFWGGGHILQMSYTTTLIVAWFILVEACGYKNPLPRKYIYILFIINLLSCLTAPFFYISSDNSTWIFATHMRIFPGISSFIAGITILYTVLRQNCIHKDVEGLKPFLILSIVLFGYGGVLAYMISGTNVTIPAHYHGSIVGITLAFMGVVYHFMPKVGYHTPTGFIAKIQPYIYGIGQAMHITGLAIMGGYGALRKDAASSQNIDTILGKTLFFSGGSFAILGGLIFVVVIFKAMKNTQPTA